MSDPVPTAEDVAAWMVEQYRENDYLDQSVAAYGIREYFGEDFVYDNANGNMAIVRPVLDAFNSMTGADVVWSRGARAWRAREDYDNPGRQQP